MGNQTNVPHAEPVLTRTQQSSPSPCPSWVFLSLGQAVWNDQIPPNGLESVNHFNWIRSRWTVYGMLPDQMFASKPCNPWQGLQSFGKTRSCQIYVAFPENLLLTQPWFRWNADLSREQAAGDRSWPHMYLTQNSARSGLCLATELPPP